MQKNIEIYFSEISETETAETADLMRLVSEKKQEKLKRFHFPADRKLGLYAEILVRMQAARRLGLANEEIIFAANEFGKPYLPDHPAFNFNISHTRSAIAVAFSDETIGVDIEKIKAADLRIADRFFTAAEQNYIHSSEKPERAFFEMWTKKEAYIKCLGTGLATSLNSFDVLSGEITPLLRSCETSGYIISVCGKTPIAQPPSFFRLSEADIAGYSKRGSETDL
jgi:4'-phosphopantetheinyl transferase